MMEIGRESTTTHNKGKGVMRDSGSLPRSSWRDFLARVQAGDLITGDFKLTCIDSMDTVLEALQVLKQGNIVSAPVWDKERSTFLGFIDVLDIICLIFDKMTVDDILNEKGSVQSKISSMQIKEAANISESNPWCPVYIGKPLLSVMDMFSSGGQLYRVPIADEQGKVVSIISQSKVVEFLNDIIKQFGNAAERSVGECFSPKFVASIHFDDLVINAFLKITETGLHGLAVIDDDGVLVGNISASDMKSVIIDNLCAGLKEPVSVVMKRSAETFERPFRAMYCFTTDTLQQVLQIFTTEQIHRLYIVDAEKKLLGVISLGDIIDVLDRLDLDL